MVHLNTKVFGAPSFRVWRASKGRGAYRPRKTSCRSLSRHWERTLIPVAIRTLPLRRKINLAHACSTKGILATIINGTIKGFAPPTASSYRRLPSLPSSSHDLDVRRDLHVSGNAHVTGNVKVKGDVVLLTNGADCAEDFDIIDVQSLESGTIWDYFRGWRLQACNRFGQKAIA
jgi:hypothetical protein